MHENDGGYFEYDDHQPPLCVKAATPQEEWKFMDVELNAYLQESYKYGLKHEHAILPSGMSAGEAGIFYFRKLHNKRRKMERVDVNIEAIQQQLAENLQKHMGIDVTSKDMEEVYSKYINPSIFQTKQYKRRLLQNVKLFLQEIRMKSKGYTSKLRNVMSSLTFPKASSAPP